MSFGDVSERYGKRSKSTVYSGAVTIIPEGYDLRQSLYRLPETPAVLSYGQHYPLLISGDDWYIWYNTTYYSATTAKHQHDARCILYDLGYRATEFTAVIPTAQADRIYTYRRYMPLRDVAGYNVCHHCEDKPIFYLQADRLYQHLRSAHPRKGKEDADAIKTLYGPF